MSNKKQFDLTEGRILNRLLLISLPIIGSNVFQMLYMFIDMFFLGRLSSDAVAASGTAGMYIWLSMALFLIGAMGAEIGVSQNLGAQKPEQAKIFSQNATFLSLILGTLFSIILILFSNPLIGFFQIQEAHVAADAALYLRIFACGMPIMFVNASITSSFNGSGNSRLPFVIRSIVTVFNIIITPIFIFTLGWGIAGAALSTVVAQIVSFVALMIAIKKHKQRPFEEYYYRDIFRWDYKVIKQIFKWAIPVSLESLCFTVFSMVITRYVTAFGAGALATQRVGSQIESLTWLVGGGFAAAFTSYVGQNFGAKKWDRIRSGFKVAAGIMTTYGVLITFVMFFGARFLFSLFIREPYIIEMGIEYLRLFAFVQLITCVESLAAGAFRGVGKTKPPSINSIIFNGLRIPVAIGLSYTPLGLTGIWIGIVICAALRGISLMIWYYVYNRKMVLQQTSAELGV